MHTNILLPLKRDDYWGRNLNEEVMDSLSTLESIRATIGNEAFSVLIRNCDLANTISRCREKVSSVRPGKHRHVLSTVENIRSAITEQDLSGDPRRNRINIPLSNRLTIFTQKRKENVHVIVKMHLDAGNYDDTQVVLLDSNSPQKPGIDISRRRKRWTEKQWDVSYTIRVPRNWSTSGAYQIANAFNNNFIPLTCEKLPSTPEHQLFKVNRVKIKAVSGEPEYNLSYSDGFVAYIDRSTDRKDPLVGWGESPEDASKALAKARAKEARERLLRV